MQVGSSAYMHHTNIRGYMHGAHMWFLETRVQQMRVNVNRILTSTYIVFFLCVHWAVVMINVGLTQVRPKQSTLKQLHPLLYCCYRVLTHHH